MKVFFVSLGCDKNKVDSEKILRLFIEKTNAKVVMVPEEADVAIINTCSFIRDAKIESIEWIKYLISLKKRHIIKKILVVGCFATLLIKYDKFEDIDFDKKDIDCMLPLNNYQNGLDMVNDRVFDILSFSSFIKICDGCDKFCSYCIIPYLRGRFRSRPYDSIIDEVKLLAKNGVKELNVIGQDILSYGKDFGSDNKCRENIIGLLDGISKVKGISWIRLMYCYPEEIDDSIIRLIKNNEKIIPYIDMPIQHISDKILKLMNRKSTSKTIREVIYKLRKEIKDICIRTTLLVGFPGETDDDFNKLLEFIKEIEFDKLGVFSYSREKLSKSYGLMGQVDDAIKEKRRKIILDIQKDIVKKKNYEKISKTYRALVEGYDRKKKMYVVRPYFNARSIDDNVYVKSDNMLMSGDFVDVKISKILGYDLEGVVV